MKKRAIYGWAVLTESASQHWHIFKTQKLAREYKRQHGGVIYKIERSS
ncbi:hypothetical protein [Rhodanobacter sp. B04]|nr:hypothetical protein [Rhodanobacter sp. B04]